MTWSATRAIWLIPQLPRMCYSIKKTAPGERWSREKLLFVLATYGNHRRRNKEGDHPVQEVAHTGLNVGG